jgi:hypothetical protein
VMMMMMKFLTRWATVSLSTRFMFWGGLNNYREEGSGCLLGCSRDLKPVIIIIYINTVMSVNDIIIYRTINPII